MSQTQRLGGVRVRRRRAPYAVLFAAAIVLLLTGAVSTFRVISTSALRAMAADSAAAISSLSVDLHGVAGADVPIVSDRAQYERFAAADSAWRDRNARLVSVEELRARGDGKRTPREAMQDRVYRFTRAGRRQPAIGELERWVRDHPRDEEAVLSLARLLRESGRTDDALHRYRDALALHRGR